MLDKETHLQTTRFLGGAFSSIHISFLQFGEKKMYDSVCVMCVCVCVLVKDSLCETCFDFLSNNLD